MVITKRDSRSPVPKNAAVTRVMKANKGKNTGPELAIRRALVAVGLNGYRLHWKKVPGRPDIAFPGRKIAIQVHGCFWHRCPYCRLPMPKNNKAYWREKLLRNHERDTANLRKLRRDGWVVFVIWECQFERATSKLVSKVQAALAARGRRFS